MIFPDQPRYAAAVLFDYAKNMLECAGLPSDRARIAAEILLEADLMGHSTHGLALLAGYLGEIESGRMVREGEPEVVADHGAALTWDGRYLPGPWLVTRAIDTALERMATHPIVTIVIRRSHHIACLAAYPKRATDRGCMLLLASSDPNNQSVAPFGGLSPLYTPNPIAAGIPTQGDPIILDVSMSTTSNGLVARRRKNGEMLPGDWVMDAEGQPTDNPGALFTNPPGTVLPLGGADLGYKGFALGLLVEALTSALGGFGRADAPPQWGASVFLQVINPEVFGGSAAFTRETQWFADAAHANPTRPGEPPVRLPGERGLRLRAEQLEHGVTLYPTILPSLEAWATKLGVERPDCR